MKNKIFFSPYVKAQTRECEMSINSDPNTLFKNWGPLTCFAHSFDTIQQ